MTKFCKSHRFSKYCLKKEITCPYCTNDLKLVKQEGTALDVYAIIIEECADFKLRQGLEKKLILSFDWIPEWMKRD